jgi:hypothetical protein
VDRWAFASTVKETPLERLTDLLKQVRSFTDADERDERETLLAMRYAELDRGASMRTLLDKDESFAMHVVSAWAALDGPGCMDWINTVRELKDHLSCVSAFKANYAHSSPERYLEMVDRDPASEKRFHGAYTDIFTALCRRSPQDAIKALPKVKIARGRLDGYAAVGATWARRDPTAALAWAKGLEQRHERANALNAVVGVLAETDPHAAIKGLNLIDTGGEPNGVSPHQAIAAGLAKIDFNEAVSWVKSLDPVRHNLEAMISQTLLASLPKVNAKALVDLYQGVDVSGRVADFSEQLNIGSGLLNALLHWTPTDASAAFAEVKTMPTGASRDTVLNYLGWKLAQQDPATAMKIAESADASIKSMLAGHLTRTLAKAGKVADLLAAVKLGAGSGQLLNPLRDAATALSLNFPERNAEFLTGLPDDLRPAAASKMIPALVTRDPESALALANSMRPEEQPAQLGVVAAEWAKQNSTNSMRWAESLPAGPQRDAAASALAGTLFNKEPHNAFYWAHEISVPEQRVRQQQSVMHEWLFQDAVAARSALAAARLTNEEQAQVLQRIDTGHPNPAALDRDLNYEPIPDIKE